MAKRKDPRATFNAHPLLLGGNGILEMRANLIYSQSQGLRGSGCVLDRLKTRIDIGKGDSVARIIGTQTPLIGNHPKNRC